MDYQTAFDILTARPSVRHIMITDRDGELLKISDNCEESPGFGKTVANVIYNEGHVSVFKLSLRCGLFSCLKGCAGILGKDHETGQILVIFSHSDLIVTVIGSEEHGKSYLKHVKHAMGMNVDIDINNNGNQMAVLDHGNRYRG